MLFTATVAYKFWLWISWKTRFRIDTKNIQKGLCLTAKQLYFVLKRQLHQKQGRLNLRCLAAWIGMSLNRYKACLHFRFLSSARWRYYLQCCTTTKNRFPAKILSWNSMKTYLMNHFTRYLPTGRKNGCVVVLDHVNTNENTWDNVRNAREMILIITRIGTGPSKCFFVPCLAQSKNVVYIATLDVWYFDSLLTN